MAGDANLAAQGAAERLADGAPKAGPANLDIAPEPRRATSGFQALPNALPLACLSKLIGVGDANVMKF